MFSHFLGEVQNLYLLFWVCISLTVLMGLCGWCTYTGNAWLSICGKKQSFHSLSIRLCGSFWFWVHVCYINVNVSRSYLSWNDSFRFISVWMILAKQEFEVAYPLATEITNSWVGSEIRFYLLVLKCCLRKFLQIRNVYCFIDTPSCHHPTFLSVCLILSPLPSLPHTPPKAQKIPSKQQKKPNPKPTNAHIWPRLCINDQMEMNQVSLIRVVIIRYISRKDKSICTAERDDFYSFGRISNKFKALS